MKSLNPVKLKKYIIDYFTFIPKVIKKLKTLSATLIHIRDILTPIYAHNHAEISERILEKNKLDLMLDNISCPEEGRGILCLLFKLKQFLPINNTNIIIARDSLVNGYLAPVIKQLQLQAIPLDTHLNIYLRNLPKASTIYSLDSAFSILLFNEALYLRKLRAKCKNELIVVVKIDIPEQKENNIQDNNIYSTEENKIYYSDHHIRRMLHCIGFFEVIGPFTLYSDALFTRSRIITEEGQYAVILNKEPHPPFRGISIYRAATKTFRQYSENTL